MPFNIKMKKNWATGQRTHAEAHIFLATLWQVSIYQQIMQTHTNSYLNMKGTWEQNVEKCCSMGMTPIAFETIAELECLSNFTRSNDKHIYIYLKC
jgi:hypothetical protein